MSARRTLRGPVRRHADQLVRDAQRSWRSPGVSAGVVAGGTPVWSRHVGQARVGPEESPGDGVPADDDTQFMIGSITKTFTAVLVLSLRDRGLLDLDDPLERHLPGTRHGSLTLRQMLSHSSGLQREPVGRVWETLAPPGEEQLIRELDSAERVLPPHFVFHYSNLAFALLGQVVQRLEGASWEEVCRRRILAPLGMTRTGLTPDEQTRAHGYLVHPHASTARAERRLDLAATAAMGGLWSTVSDLGRYAAFVADPPSDVLAADTLEEMCRPLVIVDLDTWTRGFGLGFEMLRRGERVLVGHGGAMPGFLAGLRVRRKEKVGAVVFANTGAGAEPVTLAGDLVEAVLDDLVAAGDPWTPSRPDPALRGVLGSWWSEGEELVLEVRDGTLWMRVPGADLPWVATRFAPDGADRYRAVEGRERGEVLELVRDEAGEVVRLYFATYALTRQPAAFAEIAAAAEDVDAADLR